MEENKTSKTIYYSAISPGLLIFIIVIFGFSFAPIFYDGFSITGIIILLLSFGFIWYAFASIKYTISENELEVTNGFLTKQSLNISEIKRIKRSYTLLASPAASFKRLEINGLAGSFVVISPKKEKEFIAHLLFLNPNIEIDPKIQ